MRNQDKKGKKQTTQQIQKRIATRKKADNFVKTPEQIKKQSESLKLSYKTGKIKSNKGKTFEEIHGIEKAKEIKQKLSIARKKQVFSDESKQKQKENSSKTIKKQRTGKTLEEIYGIERAKEIRQKQSDSHKGKKTILTPEKAFEKSEKIILSKLNNLDSIKGGKSKYYETPIGKVRGKYEKAYIDKLIRENKLLPIKPKGIKTLKGAYFPF